MASLLRWKDKYVKERLQSLSGLSCSSAASTSVVASTGRAIDRHSPRLQDPHRRLPPSVPKPPRPISSPFRSTPTNDSSSYLKQQQQLYHYDVDGKDKRKKKSTAAAGAGSAGRSSTSSEHRKNKKKAVQLQQVSPASSSRFLLNSSRLMMQSDDEITVVDSLPPLPSPRPSFIDDAANADDNIDIFPSQGDAVLPAVSSRPQLLTPPPPVDLFAEPSASGAGSSSSSSSSDIRGGHDHVVAGDNTVMVRSCSTRTGQHQVSRLLRPAASSIINRCMNL